MKWLSKLCSKKKSNSNVITRAGEPDVYSFPSDSERLNWTIEKAKLTVHYFVECVKAPKAGQQYFSVKVNIQDDTYSEHIWLIKPELDDEGNLYGIVGNEPLDVKSVRLNQKIGVDKDLISDWMIVQNGRLIGGYTIRCIRDGMSGSELKQHDEELGYLIVDDGEDYFIPDFETPEGAILCNEIAYVEEDMEQAMACIAFDIEAELMLKRASVLCNPETIQIAAEGLRLSFRKGIRKNGFPDFKNVTRAFPKREKLTDKHWIITEVVYFPDGTHSRQRIRTYLTENGWRVLHPED
jgi:uncharacterized protein YegJ (DUF2314 family)